jgi:hypothetical protein
MPELGAGRRGAARDVREPAPGEDDYDFDEQSLEEIKARRQRIVAPTASRTADESMIRFQERGGLKQATEVLIARLQAENDEIVLGAAVQILIHLGARRSAVEAWWQNTGVEAGVWLRVAAQLGALQSADATQLQLLAAVTRNLVATAPVLPTLINTGACILDDGLVSACVRELATGAIDVGRSATEEPYRRLAAAASVHRFYEHRTVEPKHPSKRPSNRRRGRVRSASPVWNSAVQALERAHEGTGWREAKAWHDSLDAVAGVFGGDCWAVREAVLATPELALSAGSVTPSLSVGATWRDVALWRAKAVEHRSNPDWFIGEGAKCSDGLARMSFAVFALTATKPSVLPSVLGAVDDVLRPLDLHEWAVTSAALHRYASHSVAPSEIGMTDPLRLQKVTPSARLAVLLWHLSNEATRTRLVRHVVPELEALWGCGFSVTSVLLACLEIWDKKVPVSKFNGSRFDVPTGAVQLDRITQVTLPVAERILARPQEWPTDLVRAAVDRLSSRLANQVPVLEVAHAGGWGT